MRKASQDAHIAGDVYVTKNRRRARSGFAPIVAHLRVFVQIFHVNH